MELVERFSALPLLPPQDGFRDERDFDERQLGGWYTYWGQGVVSFVTR